MKLMAVFLFILFGFNIHATPKQELQAACNAIKPFSPQVRENQRPICACVAKNMDLSLSQENMQLLISYYKKELSNSDFVAQNEELANWDLAVTDACLEDHDYTWEAKGRNPDGSGFLKGLKTEDPKFPEADTPAPDSKASEKNSD